MPNDISMTSDLDDNQMLTTTDNLISDLDDNQMLTTTDNPWSPFDNFDEWYAYDVAHGYNTCAYISRVTGNLDPELDDYTNDYILTKALNEIISMNLTGNYILVTRNSFANSKKRFVIGIKPIEY